VGRKEKVVFKDNACQIMFVSSFFVYACNYFPFSSESTHPSEISTLYEETKKVAAPTLEQDLFQIKCTQQSYM